MNSFLVLSLIGGLLAVDDRAGWQSLLAQPVFGALLVGAAVGELQTAMAVGLTLELIYLSIFPMRGLRRPDQVAGAVVGAGSAALVVHLTADPRSALVIGVGVLAGLFAGEISGRAAAPLFARQNRYLGSVRFPDETPSKRIDRRLTWVHAGSVCYIFIVEFVIVWVLLRLGFYATETITRYVGDGLAAGIEDWLAVLPALGAAALVYTFWHQHLKRVLIVSAVMVVLVLWLQ